MMMFVPAEVERGSRHQADHEQAPPGREDRGRVRGRARGGVDEPHAW